MAGADIQCPGWGPLTLVGTQAWSCLAPDFRVQGEGTGVWAQWEFGASDKQGRVGFIFKALSQPWVWVCSVGGAWLPLEQMLSLPQVDPVVVITSSLFIFKAAFLPGPTYRSYLTSCTSRTSWFAGQLKPLSRETSGMAPRVGA